jgi:folate-dependent phosphoribosylglycinamide formyltransferase PurN
MADCVGFLEKSGREIDTAEVEGQDKNVRRRENREILEMLEYVRADALCLCGFQKELKGKRCRVRSMWYVAIV